MAPMVERIFFFLSGGSMKQHQGEEEDYMKTYPMKTNNIF